jgi:hypothetical protein
MKENDKKIINAFFKLPKIYWFILKSFLIGIIIIIPFVLIMSIIIRLLIK